MSAKFHRLSSMHTTACRHDQETCMQTSKCTANTLTYDQDRLSIIHIIHVSARIVVHNCGTKYGTNMFQ